MSSIKDVASLAGVSTATVSHVVNHTRHVSPETRHRVERAIKQLNFQPNPLARALAYRRKRRGATHDEPAVK